MSDSSPSVDVHSNQCSCDQDAAHLAFDLARQFITIAIGGIGFTVGLSYTTIIPLSTTVFWSVLIAFVLAVAFGLLFIMHGIGRLSRLGSYNVYIPSLRIISFLQILSVVVGVCLLCLFLRQPNDSSTNAIVVKTGDTVLTYPNELNKRHEIKIEGSTVIFSGFSEERLQRCK